MRTLLLMALFLPTVASATPLVMSQQGRLLDSAGTPLDGNHDVSVTLYDDPSGGNALWSETLTTTFESGYYHLKLGDADTAFDLDALDPSAVYVGLSVDGGSELTPRPALVSVPYALKAHTAENLSGGTVDASSISVNGTEVVDSSGTVVGTVSFDTLTDVPDGLADGDSDSFADLVCSEGEVIVYASGVWTCTTASAHEHTAEQITAGTLDIGVIPVGDSTGTVAAGEHTHAFGDLTGSVAKDQLPTLTAADVSALADDTTADDIGGVLATGGTFTGDVAVDGELRAGGRRVPFERTLIGRRFFDSSVVDISGSNAQLRGDASVDMGTNYSEAEIITLTVLEPGAVADDEVVTVEVEWIRECRTNDCDNQWILREAGDAGVNAQIGTWDNDGGDLATRSSSDDAWTSHTGQGESPVHVTATYTLHKGERTSLLIHNHRGRVNGADRYVGHDLTDALDPTEGLEFAVTRGDLGEGIRMRLLRVKVTVE